jgi:hypothetical protein
MVNMTIIAQVLQHEPRELRRWPWIGIDSRTDPGLRIPLHLTVWCIRELSSECSLKAGSTMPKSKSKCGLVLVTGGSGYIAGYCVAQLLNDGWSVRTTVRSLAKAKAARASIDNIAPKASEIEFVEADLNSDAGWGRAVVGRAVRSCSGD